MAAEADALGAIETILKENWNTSNTDNVEPRFFVTSAQNLRLDYAMKPTNIIIYSASHTTEPNGLGATHVERTVDRVSIDIRSNKSRAHLRNCYNEVRRLFASRINDPAGDQSFQQLIPIGFVDFTSFRYFRYVYDVYLRNWAVAR